MPAALIVAVLVGLAMWFGWVGAVGTWLLAVLLAAVTTAVTGWIITGITRARAVLSPTEPFTVSVEVGDWYALNRWVVEGSRPDQPPPLPGRGLREWATTHAAVRADSLKISILVEGDGPQAVILRGVRVVELTTRPPAGGTHVGYGYFTADGTIEARWFSIDLDARSPRLDRSHWPTPSNEPSFPFSVTQGEPELFWLYVSAAQADYTWRLVLDWTVNGTQYTSVIDDGGEPFALAARGSRPSFYWDDIDARWRASQSTGGHAASP
ncbi:hypothetical protein OG936_36960 [Streptomyces sp. NBC_00846]|uniref:hypothetical protein n=1 Tax=Streptomyces sp. NBC_00846 TaxID=2975849 RepID=UPI00386B8E5E|nr:hypothetical protein OG936_36960 [Streptomyces sp. NBC_00846]